MFRKLEKAKRYWTWRLKPAQNMPLFWHVGRPNFGDDINPSFFECLTGRRVRFAIDQSRSHLLGIGSVLESATPISVVLGSGYLRKTSGPLPSGAKIISLRGERSLELARCRESVLLGDPLVLIDRVFDKHVEKRHEVGVIPHVLNVARMKKEYAKLAHVISPAQDPWKVLEDIASCSRVISQSLHGLIVADAMEIPNLWLAPSESMAGGRFKFDDYFSTLDQEKEPIGESADVFRNLSSYPLSVCRYKYCKAVYLAALEEALSSFSITSQAIHKRVA